VPSLPLSPRAGHLPFPGAHEVFTVSGHTAPMNVSRIPSSDPSSSITFARVGVIGDVHAEHDRLEKVLEWLSGQNVDAIICTGDLADGRGCIDRTCALLDSAGAIAVAGNHDRWLLQDRVRHLPDAHRLEAINDRTADYLRGLPTSVTLETTAGSLMLCHGVGENDLAKIWPGTERSPIERSARLDEIIATERFRFLVNGHLHYRVMIDFENLLVLNAGTLKGGYAGVSVMDFSADGVSSFAVTDEGPPVLVAEHTLSPTSSRRIWRDTQCFDGAWEPLALYARPPGQSTARQAAS
jgi:predicted phosphodiesterase